MLLIKNYLSHLKNNYLLILVLLSLLIFSFKWFFSYYYFDDSMDVRIIFDTKDDGYLYYAQTAFLGNLGFLQELYEPKIVIQAFSSILIHSILFKFFNFYGYLIGEFICIFIFLLIFFKISQTLKYPKFLSFLIPLVILTVPIIIEISFLENFSIFNNFKHIYNLRYPNPMVSNLFLFYFIYFLFKLENNYILNYKNFFILALLLSLTFCSYYYYFVAEVITFFLYIIYKENKYFFSDFKKKIKLFIFLVFLFILFSSPFLLIVLNHDIDLMQRLGSLTLSLEQKKILIFHYLNKIFNLTFISFFIFNLCTTYILKHFRSNNLHKKFILDIFFIGSIISPLIFIAFSPKITNLYHFNYAIFISFFLCIFFGFIFIIQALVKKNLFIYNNFFKTTFITLFLFINLFYNYSIYSNLNKDKNYKNFRKNFSLVTDYIKSNKESLNLKSIVTFNPQLMVWSVLHDFDEINVLSGVLTPIKNSLIENNLIKSFKFLGLNDVDFLEFFKNNKSNWRFLNEHTQLYFWFKYTANSLFTFNNSNDFSKSNLEFIKRISPLHVQSIAIPDFEFNRLKNKFINYNTDNTLNTDLIVLFDSNLIKLIKKDFEIFCYLNDDDKLLFLIVDNNDCPTD